MKEKVVVVIAQTKSLWLEMLFRKELTN